MTTEANDSDSALAIDASSGPRFSGALKSINPSTICSFILETVAWPRGLGTANPVMLTRANYALSRMARFVALLEMRLICGLAECGLLPSAALAKPNHFSDRQGRSAISVICAERIRDRHARCSTYSAASATQPRPRGPAKRRSHF